MKPVFDFHQGNTPLLISMPHSGTALPDNIRTRLTPTALTLPDTDWHIPRLYEFANGLGASIIKANYSRYVIDLNRPPDNKAMYPGQAGTGLCPHILFDGSPLYVDGSSVGEEEMAQRTAVYWMPYHDTIRDRLDDIVSKYGYALLYDAHSIASEVPRLFEGTLPVLNLGTAKGKSCAPNIEQAATKVIADSGFTFAINDRFIGGYITRHYGDPANNIHSMQMEIGRSSYMNEEGFTYDQAKSEKLQPVLRSILEAALESSSR